MPRLNITFQILMLVLLSQTARGQNSVPPNITSSLNVSATIGDLFVYQILADGETPITFIANPLPLSLTLNGDTISGVLRESGIFDITLTAFNMAGSQDRVLRLTVFNDGSNSNNPVFVSPPIATPNPALVGSPVVFTAVATDGDGDVLGYVWNFGDTLTGIGPTTFHTYAFSGVYTARVTVTDGANSISADLAVIVTDENGGGGVVNEFDVVRAGIAFNFTRDDRDRLEITGIVPLEAGFRPAGTSVSATVGSVTRSFTLRSNGTGGDGMNTFALTGPVRFGTGVVALPARFRLVLKRQDLFSGMQSLGFANANVRRQVITFPIQIVFNGEVFNENVAVVYNAKANKRGSAR